MAGRTVKEYPHRAIVPSIAHPIGSTDAREKSPAFRKSRIRIAGQLKKVLVMPYAQKIASWTIILTQNISCLYSVHG